MGISNFLQKLNTRNSTPVKSLRLDRKNPFNVLKKVKEKCVKIAFLTMTIILWMV
jgi:hypothetical protein